MEVVYAEGIGELTLTKHAVRRKRLREITNADIEDVFRTFTSVTIHESGGCTYSNGLIGVGVAFDTLTIITVFYVFDVTLDNRYLRFKRPQYKKLRKELLRLDGREVKKKELTRIFDKVLSDGNEKELV